MPDTITFTLKAVDVFQILDALNDRAEAWEKTEATFDGNFQSEDLFVPEECHDASEAAEIAKHFRDVAASLEAQLNRANRQS